LIPMPGLPPKVFFFFSPPPFPFSPPLFFLVRDAKCPSAKLVFFFDPFSSPVLLPFSYSFFFLGESPFPSLRSQSRPHCHVGFEVRRDYYGSSSFFFFGLQQGYIGTSRAIRRFFELPPFFFPFFFSPFLSLAGFDFETSVKISPFFHRRFEPARVRNITLPFPFFPFLPPFLFLALYSYRTKKNRDAPTLLQATCKQKQIGLCS